MKEKETTVKQMILGIIGGLLGSVNILNCYPLVPAWFAAFYLEEESGLLFAGLMYLGIFIFMPFVAAAKYAIAILVIMAAIRLVEWANESCPAYLSGLLAAIVTMFLSFCGSLLEWRDQPAAAAVFLEGCFVMGAAILLNRMYRLLPGKSGTWGTASRQEYTGNGEKLLNYAESFQGLSKIFQSMSLHTEDEPGRIQSELMGKVCAGCDGCALREEGCRESFHDTLARLLDSIKLHKGETAESERIVDELGQYCIKSRDMVEEAVHIFERVSLNRAWYHRLLENRQVIADQLDAMAFIMQDCAKTERLLDDVEKRAFSDIRYYAGEVGIVTEEMHLTEMTDGHIRLEAVLRSKKGGCIALRSFTMAAGRALGRRMRPASEAKSFVAKEAAGFCFYEDTLYRSVQGIARRKKDGAQISGDNFTFLELEHGELLLGLSDGMGSGSTACRESEMVLDLVERFTEAGFSVETAIRMMNAAMVMKGEDDLYSTIDLCRINLYDGQAMLYKIGASATFIKHGEDVMAVASSNLPVGVGPQVEIEMQDISLSGGDFVVMVTDGVLEYLHVPEPLETMKEMIGGIDTNNPGILAKRMLERVLLFTGGTVPDDMTILAAGIWEK